jgi:uncharacterized membrane protein
MRRVSVAVATALAVCSLAVPDRAAAQSQTAEIQLSKTASPTSFSAAGQTITYTYQVTNSGTVNLTDITVEDNKAVPVNCPATALPPGSSFTCSGTYITSDMDVGEGSITNVAVANARCGDLCEVSAQAVATVTFQGLRLSKSASPNTFTAAGETITYSYTVTNAGSGSVTLVSVSDNKVSAVACPPTLLAPGSSLTCTGTYLTADADVAAGVIINTATASGQTCNEGCTTLTSAPAQAFVSLVSRPSLSLSKSASPTFYTASGQTISYSYTVQNTGNVSLGAVSISDDRVSSISCPATNPAPGETVVCTGTYVTTESDVTAGTVTNTATAMAATAACDEDCAVTSASAQATILLLGRASLALAKSAVPSTYTSVGQTIAYSYTVTNTGSLPISSVSVSDDKVTLVSCPAAPLAPSTSTTCSGSYTITAADLGAGSVTNTATASGQSCGDSCTVSSPPAQATITLQRQPALTLSKSASPVTYTTAGQTIAYTYNVTNSGNTALTAISVADDRVSPVSCPAGPLAPGASLTCTGTYTTTAADVTAGSVTNTATASGSCGESCSATSQPAQATITFQAQPALTLAKSATPTTYTAAGQPIGYSYTVTNSGNTTLTAISVADDRVSPVSCPAGPLVPGASLTCTGTYTTTAADVTAGSVTNTATASGSCGESACATSQPAQATITFQAQPALTLSKAASPTTYTAAGQTIGYSYTVTNSGTATFTAISVADDRVSPVSCPAGPLAPGASLTCTGTYTTTAADVTAGSVTNTATASGSCGESACATSQPAQATITFQAQPALTLSKSASPTTYTAAGQTIGYSYDVTNTGNVALDTISVSDDRVSAASCPATTLAPGASLTCTGTYTTTAADVTAGSVTNTATASGSCGESCSATSQPAQATITFRAPPTGSVTIVKLAGGGDNSFSFASNNGGIPDFTLTTTQGSATRIFADLSPATFVLTEVNLPAEWELADLSCSGDTGGTPTTANLSERSVSIGLDGGEAITCTFTNRFDVEAHRLATRNIIHEFLRHRVDRLAAEEPDRSRILRRIPGAIWGDTGQSAGAAGAPLAFSGTTGDSSSNLAFATSLLQLSDGLTAAANRALQLEPPPFDVWVEAHYSHFLDDSGDLDSKGDFGLVYLGADYLLTPAVLVGALVQMDWLKEASGTNGSEVEGTGFMAGPYLSARITPHLLFDARAAWGLSDNTIDPFGLYEDDFSTNRWLANARLTGTWNFGNFRISPSLGVTYVEEEQQSYMDSVGVFIPGQTVSLGRVAFGPEFAYRMLGPDGLVFEPQLSVTGLWDFDSPEQSTTSGFVAGDDLRARLQAGLQATAPGGASMRVTGTVDGIGAEDFDSLGGQVWISIPLR